MSDESSELARSYRTPSVGDVAAVAFGAWGIFTLLVAHASFAATVMIDGDVSSALGSAVVGAGVSSAFGLIATTLIGFPLGVGLSRIIRRVSRPLVHVIAYSALAWLICLGIWFTGWSLDSLPWTLLPTVSTAAAWIIRWRDSGPEPRTAA